MTVETIETVYPEANMNFIHVAEGGLVTELCNPITRSWAKLSPHFDPDLPNRGMDGIAELQFRFAEFCESCWTAAPWRRDPHLVNPYAVLDGTEQVHPIDSVIDNLIDEYGFWLVSAEIEKRRPA